MFVGGFAVSKMKSMMVFNVFFFFFVEKTEHGDIYELFKIKFIMNAHELDGFWVRINSRDGLAVPLPFGSEHVFAKHFNDMTESFNLMANENHFHIYLSHVSYYSRRENEYGEWIPFKVRNNSSRMNDANIPWWFQWHIV